MTSYSKNLGGMDPCAPLAALMYGSCGKSLRKKLHWWCSAQKRRFNADDQQAVDLYSW